MPGDYLEKIDTLMQQSDAHQGEASIALMQEAARIADQHNDLEAGMRVRYWIIHDGNDAGLNDIVLVAFTWILSKIDADPDAELLFPNDVMWFFKWIAGNSAETPRLSRKQIEGLLDDMERRYLERGLSLRAVEQLRSTIAIDMGEAELARKHLDRARQLPNDGAADCLACQTNSLVQLLAFIGDLDDAVAAAEPIRRGHQSCAEVPALTAGALMMPLFEAGRLIEADSWQRKVHRRISQDGGLLSVVGKSMQFLAVTDQLRRATNLMDKKLRFATENVSPMDRLFFFMGCRALCLRLAQKKRSVMKLKSFPTMPWKADDHGRFDVAEMSEWFFAKATELATQFDQRNGNSYYGDQLTINESLVDRVQPVPKPSEDAKQDAQ